MIDYYIVETRLNRTGQVVSRNEFYSLHAAEHHKDYVNDCLKTRTASIIKVYC